MIYDAFKPMPPQQAQDFLTQVAPLMDGDPFGGAVPRVLTRDLPFYAGYELVEAVNQSIYPPVMRAFVRNKADKQVTLLNWTNEPVYHLNAAVPIALSDDTALAYARFFFTYIKGKHGRFLLVDSPDDIEWKDEPPPAGRKALARMIDPLALINKEADGTRILTGSMIFKDSLFAAKIKITPDGQVTLFDEELLVEDIPVRDDVLGL